jgi:hypothetical protein
MINDIIKTKTWLALPMKSWFSVCFVELLWLLTRIYVFGMQEEEHEDKSPCKSPTQKFQSSARGSREV